MWITTPEGHEFDNATAPLECRSCGTDYGDARWTDPCPVSIPAMQHEWYDDGSGVRALVPGEPCLVCGVLWGRGLDPRCPIPAPSPLVATSVANVISNAQTWASDGHRYDAVGDGCMRCGVGYDAYLQGPVPCGGGFGELPTLPPFPEGPAPWAHGYCVVCDVEICPPLDGEGAELCKKCDREQPAWT